MLSLFMQAIASRITRKYLLIFSVVLVIPIIAVYQVIVHYAQDVMEEHIIRDNLLGADAIVKRLNAEINDAELQLQLIVGQNNGLFVDESKMYESSNQTISKSTIIHSIYYIDNHGQMKFEAPLSPSIQGVHYPYAGLNHVRWSYTYMVSGMVENYRGEGVVTIAVPVFLKNRAFQGALIAELSRDYLSEVLKNMSANREGFSYLLDQNGKVIASSDEEVREQTFALDPIGIRLMKGDSGIAAGSYQGETSIIAFQQMRDNWGLALGVPQSIAFQPIQTLGKALTISFFVIFALALFFILMGMRHLLYPILSLTRFANRYRQEHALQMPIPVQKKSKDELSELMSTMKALTREIDSKERFLHDVIEGIPYALLTINHNGLITHVNENFIRLFRVSSAQLLHQPVEVIELLKVIPTLKKETELTMIDDSGDRHIVRVIPATFQEGILAVLQDVTQIKLLEEQVNQSKKLAQMGQITAGIAHELKNPLAVLASSSELLKEEIQNVQGPELIKTLVFDIDEEIDRMSGIVSQFLSFARTKSEETSWIEIDQLIDRVLHLLRFQFSEQNVSLRKDYEPLLPAIHGKYNKLMQLFLNLFLNSMEAMPGGGKLSITIGRKEQFVEVRIEDSGLGISPNDLRWLFNPFFSTKEQGTGLGLTIASEIVKEHSGEIQIESDLQLGTTVTCKFPIQAEGEMFHDHASRINRR